MRLTVYARYTDFGLRFLGLNVRFGSKADIELILTNMQRDRPDALCYRRAGQRATYTPVRI